MNIKEISLYFLGSVPIQYFGLDPIDPRSSFLLNCDQRLTLDFVTPAVKALRLQLSNVHSNAIRRSSDIGCTPSLPPHVSSLVWIKTRLVALQCQ